MTKVLSKIQSGTRALFVRTGAVETPFPGRFLQPLAVTEAEAESSTLQKEFGVKRGRRTPPALDGKIDFFCERALICLKSIFFSSQNLSDSDFSIFTLINYHE